MKLFYFKDCEHYIIQNATDLYIEKLMNFFVDHLSAEHLLACSKAFIQKQFYNASIDVYNILVAIEKDNDEILGIMCFVDTLFYDENAKENFVWLTNWLTSKTKYKTVGIHLLYALFDYKQGSTFGTTGNNDISGAIYKKLGFTCGMLSQFFIVNETIENFYLLKGNFAAKKPYGHSFLFAPYKNDTFESLPYTFPYKSKTYFENKYINSPFYRYDLLSIKEQNKIKGLLVTKTDSHHGKSALRIVDFAGDINCLSHIGNALQSYVQEKKAEYLDFYCYGISDEILYKSGFLKNQMDNDTIVPCYFEPFQAANVPISFCYQTDKPFIICKGDGDRDFPRILSKVETR